MNCFRRASVLRPFHLVAIASALSGVPVMVAAQSGGASRPAQAQPAAKPKLSAPATAPLRPRQG